MSAQPPSLDVLLDQLAEAVATKVAERIGKRSAEQPEREAKPPDFFSEAAIARRTGLSVRTLQSWRATGRGPAWVKAGCRVLYPRAELEEFLNSRSPSGLRKASAPRRPRTTARRNPV